MDISKGFAVSCLLMVTISWVNALPKYDWPANDEGMVGDTHSWANRGTTPIKEQRRRPRKGCGGKSADIYFIIDSSDGVSREEFEQRKQFASELINMFVFRKKRTRVGVISFGRGPLETIRLGEYKSKSSLRAAIKKTKYIGGDRNTYATLYYVKNMAFFRSRQGVAHIAIILSNGFSSDYLRTVNEAFYAKKKGIYFYSVGTSGTMDKKELTAVASNPASNFVFDVNSNEIAPSLRKLLKIGQCPDQIEQVLEVQPTTSPRVCSARRQVDVIFALENLSISMSNSLNIMSLLKDILLKMDNTDDKVRVGIVTSRSPRFGKLFSSSPQTINRTLSVIGGNRRRIPNLTDLLRRVRKTAHKGRDGVQKTAVIFMDNNVPITKSAISESRRNKLLKIDTYVVFVGEKMSFEDIRALSSGKLGDYIIQIGDYGTLMQSTSEILKQICRGW